MTCFAQWTENRKPSLFFLPSIPLTMKFSYKDHLSDMVLEALSLTGLNLELELQSHVRISFCYLVPQDFTHCFAQLSDIININKC